MSCLSHLIIKESIEVNLDKIDLGLKSSSPDQNEIGKLILRSNKLYNLIDGFDPKLKERIDGLYYLYEMRYLRD